MDEIKNIVFETLRAIGEIEDIPALLNPTHETKLLGGNGHLDSMGIVLLVSELEVEISDKLGSDIVLADDRSMSRRTSPFRSVGSLCSYVDELLAAR